MNVEIQVNNSTAANARYLSWAPSPCRIRVTNPAGATGTTASIRITATSAASAGAVQFRQGTSGTFATSLTLTVPVNGASVPFFMAGRRASVNDGDVTVEARFGTAIVGTVRVMVRIRKNANTLTPGERDRFVSAFAKLNNQGAGRFVDFRDMHVQVSLSQAHGAPGFLPWHRAYLLDLERELQAIDRSVALPYWRFDQPSPNIFTRDFMGVADTMGTVQFSSGNPLQFWVTDGMPGINRRPTFATSTAPPGLLTEAQTLALGSVYRQFADMEFNPHGSAHVAFGGFIRNPATAPKDPLFFLLHANVDRLWAKWQRQFGRFNPALAGSYDNSSTLVGHRLADTMWPWNGVTGGTRPPTAPGGTLAAGTSASAPGPSPRVADLFDLQGRILPLSRMGYDYDDVPFT